MKRKLMVLAGLFMMFQFVLALSCGYPYYDVKDGSVKYNKHGKIKDMKEVDFETFRKSDRYLGLDKNHVYYEGKIIKGIDAKTFEILSWYKPKPIEGSPWGIGCQISYIENFKDKNGEYTIYDIRVGVHELIE